jgi:hypothetical protein
MAWSFSPAVIRCKNTNLKHVCICMLMPYKNTCIFMPDDGLWEGLKHVALLLQQSSVLCWMSIYLYLVIMNHEIMGWTSWQLVVWTGLGLQSSLPVSVVVDFVSNEWSGLASRILQETKGMMRLWNTETAGCPNPAWRAKGQGNEQDNNRGFYCTH